MTAAHDPLSDPRVQAAVEEIKGLIACHYPEATFTVGLGDDPEGVYLRPVVDIEDRGEVVDVFLDRLVEFQVEDALPLYVVVDRPPERNAAILRAGQSRTAAVTAVS